MLRQHVVYGLRRIRSNPLFSAIVILCLALGIGANTAIFSVVNTALLRPLPYKDPDRIMMLSDTHVGESGEVEPYSVTPPNYDEWRRTSNSFQGLAGIQLKSYNLTKSGEPQRVDGADVTRDFFELFGVAPERGRTFTADEDRPGGHKAVILSHGLWQRQFSGDPEVMGSSLTLDDQVYTVVGIMPPDFEFPHKAEIWTPLALNPQQAPANGFHNLYVTGRLKPQVSVERAQSEMDLLAHRLESAHPDSNAGWGVRVEPIRLWLLGDVRPYLVALSLTVGFVLLIACLNVANMLLARATSRNGEVAVRIAIGAQRKHLVSQLLVESVLLALLGGAMGVLLAYWVTQRLVSLMPSEMINNFQEVTIDGSVLAFTFLLSVITGFLFGIVPALKSFNPDLLSALNEGGRRLMAGRGGIRLQRLLVIVETALALLLLVCAGLMLKSLNRLHSVDAGFDPRGLLTMRLTLSNTKYPEVRQRADFFDRVIARVATLPGVQAAGVATVLPADKRVFSYIFTVEGRPLTSQGEMLVANSRLVSAGFLDAMRIHLRAGRSFNANDYVKGAPLVAIISERMARRYWPESSPLGKRLKRGGADSKNPWITVVGVVADVRDKGLAAGGAETWYLPYSQQPFSSANLVVRTRLDPASLIDSTRRAILDIDPDQPVSEVALVEDLVGSSISKQSFSAILLGFLGSVGLLLAVTGIYGIMSYTIHQRFHELGLRMALGARIRDVLTMVLRQGLALTLTGVAFGLLCALAATNLLSKLLFEVSSLDPVTFVLSAVLLSTAGLLATYLTARKAATINPVIALTSD
jgi:putative ABC transport system permease protein